MFQTEVRSRFKASILPRRSLQGVPLRNVATAKPRVVRIKGSVEGAIYRHGSEYEHVVSHSANKEGERGPGRSVACVMRRLEMNVLRGNGRQTA